ncbi:MAG: methylated-DNA-(protein)-cysteine S-methyltransferase, nonfunctional [Berkelbacteria bacterium GW2011_GWA1_36_9]|uniref:Methylated-DNA-(Protein)-cysteine S-methyltransferase, nonfunctional n=1 Tax=Berkelbacteria bacterium GW2011_GWA1_36_9 TaxID=1618331 RepID=A0A0G0FI06_9BACT|nr:MAG: methylated-DNA-(protein)-cysteine S-methyltransferase, nonfunctional [Berkelbacteria bacterium GW2011_GWA1_36_9]
MKNDFTRKVLTIVGKIPKGKLMTYAEVAKSANSPRAYRAVGSILNRNFHQHERQLPIKDFPPVPCHRVIRSNGIVGGYALGQKEKEKILTAEGHTIVSHKIKLN